MMGILVPLEARAQGGSADAGVDAGPPPAGDLPQVDPSGHPPPPAGNPTPDGSETESASAPDDPTPAPTEVRDPGAAPAGIDAAAAPIGSRPARVTAPSGDAAEHATSASASENGIDGDTAGAAEPDLEDLVGEVGSIEELSLEDLLDRPVTTATGIGQTVRETPAIVTVVTADEIRARGLLTLADVLRTVPGFYDVYDLVTHNMGVRGVSGGLRASGSVLKVMIDGHPMHFRTTTGNFLGEELIPMAAVERVEVIRGPASALYGSNAYLGVVNIITRSGDTITGSSLFGHGGFVREELAYGGGLLVGAHADGAEALVAAQMFELDRSGLGVPSTSPILQRSANPLTGGRTESLRDQSRPRSLYARASAGVSEHGRVTVSGTVQNLDANGEFLDFEPLTHRTRIALINQNYNVTYDWEPSEALAFSVYGGYFDSSPASVERLSVARSDFELRRNAGVTGWESGIEARGQPIEALSLRGGVDLEREDQVLQTFDSLLLTDVRAEDGSILRSAGTVVPGESAGRDELFYNLGAFLQAIYAFGTDVSATAGLRLDYHNVYRTHLSPRAGLVFAPADADYYAKLLYGSSFKAPSAEQLYTQPMREFDIRGNEALEAQTAQTVELAGGYNPGDFGEILGNVFLTQVSGLVEYTQRGLFRTAENARDAYYAGGELELRVAPVSHLDVQLGAGIAEAITGSDHGDRVIIEGDPPRHPLFPTVQAHLVVQYRLPWIETYDIRVIPELSYVGPRESSQSNALENGTVYELDAIFYTALSFSMHKQLGDAMGIDATLRGTNLFNQENAEPGFGGIDVPSLGRTVFLTLGVTQLQ